MFYTDLDCILLYFKRGRLAFVVGWGRVYEIVGFWQLWLVEPAPTIFMFFEGI
jgi:hypothetical protein